MEEQVFLLLTADGRSQFYRSPSEAEAAQYANPGSVVQIINTKKMEIDSNSVAYQIKVAPGEHVVVYGKVQSGKRREKLELARRLIHQHNLAVIVLFRCNNLDYSQFSGSIEEANVSWRKRGLSGLMDMDIRQKAKQLPDLLRTPSLLLGLADPDTVKIINDCLDAHPELHQRAVLILDEADLATYELDERVRTKTEMGLSELFTKLHMMVSVTATPLSILMCNRFDQVYAMDIPEDYYGIERVKHIPVSPVMSNKASKGESRYRPQLDRDNLDRFYADVRREKQATALISVTKVTKEHKALIRHLCSRHPDDSGSVVYMECNEKKVKIYNGRGVEIGVVSETSPKGGKVADISKALEEYKDMPHIFIVAGVHAGRGVSFVSKKDRSRHLTHQYLVVSDTSSVVSTEQSLRLCGRYPESNAQLYLYCDKVVYDELVDIGKDVDKFTADIRNMPQGERVQALHSFREEWNHRILPDRQMKGIAFTYREDDTLYDLVPMPLASVYEAHQAGFTAHTLFGNRVWNFAKDLARGVFPVPKHIGDNGKETVIWCAPLEQCSMFHEYRSDIENLYRLHPEYEGRCIRRVNRSERKKAMWVAKA